ncbi:unnamed protein product, partial [Nesidiocoris tenuis]
MLGSEKITKFMGKFFASDGKTKADPSTDTLTVASAYGYAVDKIVYPVAENDHPRDGANLRFVLVHQCLQHQIHFQGTP